ncbi:unnamed protein product [Adineta steineri]|uniref:Mutator-like transposase domain-containing protein n=1 Tax=Adineta steineri TaxID=433720 RepID=A0A818WR29_9BILA|nr:unnamed protein product [Adineta steineri]CAF3729846.1 unnamed protein product [Adineta steineri]
MDILPPVHIESYKRYEDLLFTSIQEVATNEARTCCKDNDVNVSIDGTWLTQDYSSLYGLGTLVSAADPPKVLDYEILSRHCSRCTELLAVKKFDTNYEGSSGEMEEAAIYFGKRIWENGNDLEKMKKAAWSTWFHVASTGENPMHDVYDPAHCKLYFDFDYKQDGWV